MMRLIHFADLHLGFSTFDRLTKNGINQREADVAVTFSRAVDLIIERAPELVIVGGDIFHKVNPGNNAIVHAVKQFGRLTRTLRSTPVVVVAGNHDTPRTSQTGSILPLLAAAAGVHVADSVPRMFRFPALELSVLAVPDALHERPTFAPDPSSRFNVCVAHLETAGLIHGVGVEQQRKDLEVSLDELHADRFDYIGVGHYHVHRVLAPNACYSGSIDYTSSNPWGELAEERTAGLPGKGLVEFDLETRALTFLPLAPARPLIDLPAIDALGMETVAIDAAIAAGVEQLEGRLDGAIVRQVIRNLDKPGERALDWKRIRGYRGRAMHYHFDPRRPDAETPEERKARIASTPRKSLSEMLRETLEKRAAAGGIAPDVLTALGMDYMNQAAAIEADKRGGDSTIDVFATREVSDAA